MGKRKEGRKEGRKEDRYEWKEAVRRMRRKTNSVEFMFDGRKEEEKGIKKCIIRNN